MTNRPFPSNVPFDLLRSVVRDNMDRFDSLCQTTDILSFRPEFIEYVRWRYGPDGIGNSCGRNPKYIDRFNEHCIRKQQSLLQEALDL